MPLGSRFMSSPPSHDRRWILLALVVGLIGLCVGAPIGFWHLLRGESARTTAAPAETRRTAKRPPVPTEWPDPVVRCRSLACRSTRSKVPESLNPLLTEEFPLPDQLDVFVVLEPEAEQAVFLGTIAPGDTLDFGDIPCRNVQALELRLMASGRSDSRMVVERSVVVPIAPVQQVTFRVIDAIDEAPISMRGAPSRSSCVGRRPMRMGCCGGCVPGYGCRMPLVRLTSSGTAGRAAPSSTHPDTAWALFATRAVAFDRRLTPRSKSSGMTSSAR